METREELIKRYWKNNRHPWPRDRHGQRYPEFCMAVLPDWRSPPKWDGDATTVPMTDVLRFRIESGTFDGQRAERVVCEDVVVDMRFTQR